MKPSPSFLVVVALVSSAVGGIGCAERSCDLLAKSSVQLTVVDATTGEDVEATVTFLVDGEGPMQPDESFPGTYALGFELEGSFDVTIVAEGYQTEMRQYEVTADECHVMTVQDTVELTPVP
ncbi:MAG: hypothetical protein H6712_11295 [Myxococcales bacterium]|nr:hypothetical protein [Myxococcales bacterium]MCB9714437.1 hypothetical protein [Myxococcales bacterium]